jgi:hypothetical protein
MHPTPQGLGIGAVLDDLRQTVGDHVPDVTTTRLQPAAGCHPSHLVTAMVSG